MAIPNFKGYKTWPYPIITRGDIEFDKEKTFSEKASDFIKRILSLDATSTDNTSGSFDGHTYSGYNANSTIAGMKDIFGNDIMPAKDKDGDTYLAAYLKSIDENPIFKQFTKKYGTENVIEAVNQESLKQYIQTNYPGFEFQKDIYWQKFLSHKAVLETTNNLKDNYPTKKVKSQWLYAQKTNCICQKLYYRGCWII